MVRKITGAYMPHSLHYVRPQLTGNGYSSRMCGKGGSFLLQNGNGAGSSYSSVDDYVATCGKGLGLGFKMNKEQMNKKIANLMPTSSKAKTKNIKFSL
jgi:hypothetical protein